MKNQEIEELLKRYVAGTCTEQERVLLESWYLQEHAPGHNKADAPDGSAISAHMFTSDQPVALSAQELKEDLAAITAGLPLFKPARKGVMIFRIAVAALFIISLSIGLLFHSHKTTINKELTAAIIKPGGNKAFLTLGDGRRISLTDATNGNIASQSDVSIVKTADGQLIYTIKDAGDKNGEPVYNLIETPKGGQFQVILPDGTRVWLNAASSLRYPTYFSDEKRSVELTGEGYFEVAKNKTKPFVVKTSKEDIEVLGTHFNINTYTDEETLKTTLIEGSVRVKTPGDFKVLQPGQQSILKNSVLTVQNVDTDIAVAWKNGQFMFSNENIEGIMRQVSRWYNVDIVYADKPSASKVFGGTISRFENVSQILDILELTKSVKFKIEGRRIIVMK